MQDSLGIPFLFRGLLLCPKCSNNKGGKESGHILEEFTFQNALKANIFNEFHSAFKKSVGLNQTIS